MIYRLLKQRYKIILGSAALLALVMYLAAIMLFSRSYESRAVIFMPKQASSFISESLQEQENWGLQYINLDDLNRLIGDKVIQKEIGLKLLASHLVLQHANPDIISSKNFKKIHNAKSSEFKALTGKSDSVAYHNLSVQADRHPFLIEALNNMPYYNSAAISSIVLAVFGNNDMITLTYTSDDPGISRHTLDLAIDVCARYYKNLNIIRSHKIGAYYENRFQEAENELWLSDVELLKNRQAIVAQRENILKQLFDEREKILESGVTLKTVENQIGMHNSVLMRDQAIIQNLTALNNSYNLLMTDMVNDAKVDTVFVRMQINQLQAQLKQKITAIITPLQGDAQTKEKIIIECSNAMIANEQHKACLIALERQLSALYQTARLTPLDLDRIKTIDQNYLSALDNLFKSKQYQQDQAAVLPVQIIETPNSREIGGYMVIVWTLLGGLTGFVFTITLITLNSTFSKKLRTPEKTEQLVGLKVAGVIPNAERLKSRSNPNHIVNSLLYHMLWKFFQTTSKQQMILLTSINPEDGKTFVSDKISEWLYRKGKNSKVIAPRFEKGVWRVKYENASDDELMSFESLPKSDVLIMILPALVTAEYPIELIRKFSIIFLVCNANKTWAPADRKILDHFIELSKRIPQIILNNVNTDVVEDVLEKINMMKTHFATPQRSSDRVIRREHKIIKNNRQAQQIVKTMPNLGVILDKNRQIVYANEAITSLLGLGSMDNTLGLRPGELVSCIYSDVMASGCGTSESCQKCGAVNTIVKCIKSRKFEEGECSINSFMDGQLVPFKFKITCSPFESNGDFFVIANLADIMGEEDKRNKLIENMMANVKINGDLSALDNLIEKMDENKQLDDLLNTMKLGSSTVIEDVIEYKRLIAAENGQLEMQITQLSAFSILDNAVRSVRTLKIAKNKDITLAPPFPSISIMTDAVILEHILRSMLKNAVEAVPDGSAVCAGYEKTKYAITYYVFNEGVISENLQNQIFMRGFTDKEERKGLGTYGMKLLGERYLRGHVGFKSSQESGTRFFITLPISDENEN